MVKDLINKDLENLIQNLKEILQILHETSKLIENKELEDAFDVYLKNREFAFLLTVAGEVNAGKSSIINRILGEDILDVDVVPTTDKIYYIYYNDEDDKNNENYKNDKNYKNNESKKYNKNNNNKNEKNNKNNNNKNNRNNKNNKYNKNNKNNKNDGNNDKVVTYEDNYFVKVGLKYPVLKNITIVDTPGTNSIIEQHQIITEKFIPASDIVFVVFSTENIYTNSAWQFLKYIAENWKKEIIIILNKIDKISKDELNIHIKELEKLVIKSNLDAKIFPISAINLEGFDTLKEFIKNNFENKKKLKLKYKSMLNFSKKIISLLQKDYSIFEKQFLTHQKIKEKIEQNFIKISKHFDENVINLKKDINNFLEDEKKELFDEFEELFTQSKIFEKNIKGVFVKNKSFSNYSKKVLKEFEDEIKEYIINRIKIFINNFSEYYSEKIINIEELVNEINFYENFKIIQIQFKLDKKEINNSFELFISEFNKTNNLESHSINERIENFSTMLFGGPVLTVLSLLMIAVVPGLYALVAGIVFSGLGIFLASKGIKINKKKLYKKLDKQLITFKERLNKMIDKNIVEGFNLKFKEIESNFNKFYKQVESEEKLYIQLQSNLDKVKNKINKLP